MNPETLTPKTPNRLLLIITFIAILVILGTIFAVYYAGQQKPATKTVPDQSAQTGTLIGRVIKVKDNLLTIKKADGQEIQIKLASGASVLKQVRVNSYTTSSVPAELKEGDQVSIGSEANMVLILTL